MTDALALPTVLPASPPAALERVRQVEARLLQMPQADITTWHVLHAGVYSRTILIPRGVALTGALIKIPTTLTVAGHASVLVGDDEMEIKGYHVIPAAAGRKQAFIAHEDTWLTMAFQTTARTVEEAEEEFTDEHARLMSRTGRNEIAIGDLP